MIEKHTGVIVRPANRSDANTLTEIALDAKRSWGYPEELIELWRDDLTITADFIGSNSCAVALKMGQAIGFCALTPHRIGVELEHLWVSSHHQRLGVGATLFREACRLAREQGASRMRIVSDPNASDFYARMGAIFEGELEGRPEGRVLPYFTMDVPLG